MLTSTTTILTTEEIELNDWRQCLEFCDRLCAERGTPITTVNELVVSFGFGHWLNVDAAEELIVDENRPLSNGNVDAAVEEGEVEWWMCPCSRVPRSH